MVTLLPPRTIGQGASCRASHWPTQTYDVTRDPQWTNERAIFLGFGGFSEPSALIGPEPGKVDVGGFGARQGGS